MKIQVLFQNIMAKIRSVVPAENTPTFHPFARLLTELQWMIVSYAMFIGPIRDKHGHELPLGLGCPKICTGRWICGASIRRHPCCGTWGKNEGSLSCYCQSIHTAPPTCTCPSMRNGLFGTSRAVRLLAIEALYSKNQFRVEGNAQAALESIKNVSKDFLAHIKHLNAELCEHISDLTEGRCQHIVDLLAML